MIKASDFNAIKLSVKEEKYHDMMHWQEKIIKENMEIGKHSVLFIFTDKEYFHNNMEKAWFDEFKERAERHLKENGFSIRGIVVEWK